MENPVYYVQYAHARIASIGRQAASRGIARLPVLETNLAPLVHERELDLLRSLAVFPEIVQEAAELRAPHRVATWVRDFASRFHGFYRDCRVHLRRRRAHPGAALARRGLPDRARGRAGHPRRRTRPTRCTASTTTPRSEGPRCASESPFDRSLVPAGLLALDLETLAARARHAAVRLRRGRPAAPVPRVSSRTSVPATWRTRARHSCVPRWSRLVADEGLGLDVATGGELHVALQRRLSGRRASRSTATTSRTPRSKPRSTPVSGGSSPIRPTSSTVSSGSRPRGSGRSAGRAGPGHAGCRGSHPRVHRDRHRAVEVRLHGERRRCSRRRTAGRPESGPAPRGVALPHRFADLPARFLRADGRDRRRARPPRSPPRPASRSTS